MDRKRSTDLAETGDHSPITVRPLAPADVEELTSIVVASFGDEMALSRATPAVMRAQLRAAVAASSPPLSLIARALGETVEFWVATYEGRIAGCCALHGRTHLMISTVAVAEYLRRRGIGRALMEHCIRRAGRLGKRYVLLEVLANNTPAVSLYISLGMREYDRRRSFSLNLSERGDGAFLPPELKVERLGSRNLEGWLRALAASTSMEARNLRDVYGVEYLSSRPGRWLAAHLPWERTARRVVMLNGAPVAYTCVRSRDDRARWAAEILPPIYTIEARPYLESILSELTAEAARHSKATVRLYLSEARPCEKGWEAALSLGYSSDWTWSYMYRAV